MKNKPSRNENNPKISGGPLFAKNPKPITPEIRSKLENKLELYKERIKVINWRLKAPDIGGKK